MKIVIAPDSFKESLSAPDVAEAIARGLREDSPPPPANVANAVSKARSVSRPWRTGAGWTTPPQ